MNREQIYDQLYDSIYSEGYDQAMKDNTDLEIAYNKGLEDAWECARKIGISVANGGIEYFTLKGIFGTGQVDAIFTKYSAQEAIAKIKKYEDNQKDDGFTVRDLIESDLKDMASRYSLEEIDDVLNQMRGKMSVPELQGGMRNGR